MLYRFSRFVVVCTVLLILAGSLVFSHDAGLSVPDWPTSYGWNMFTSHGPGGSRTSCTSTGIA